MWWISGQIRMERELCCDDLVIAAGTDRLTYARALTELESVRLPQMSPQLAANGGSLMDRIRRLIEPSYVGVHYLPGAGAAWAMILLLVLGAGVVPVHGAPKTTGSHPLTSAAVMAHGLPSNATPEQGRTLDSLIGQAQETLLYDPVFAGPSTEPRPAKQAQAPTGNSATAAGMVLEQVTVRTGSNAVDGLRAEDFAVTEDGNPQPLSFFEYQNIDKLDDAARMPTGPVVALPRLPHAEITPARYKDHRLLVLYFDEASTPAEDQARALETAQKFVNGQMSSADMVCLIRYAGAGPEILQDFTGDRNRLLSVLATMSRAGVPSGTDSGLVDFNADQKLAALQSVLKKLGALREKKSLVYFTGGLSLSATDNQARLRLTVNDAIRAGVSIWPVDTRPASSTQPPIKGHEALAALGGDTGGTASSGIDPAAAILSAEKNITSYYLIGYFPTNNTLDGKYRRIAIAVSNNSGAKPEYRQGYFVQNSDGPSTDKERQIEEALMAGDPATDLNIAAEVNYFRQNNAEYFTAVTVKIPASELVAGKNSGLERTEFDLAGEIKDDQGTTVSNIRDHMEIRLADLPAAVLAVRPVTYNTGIKLLPGTYSIRMLARNAETGRMGMYLGKFTIQNLNKDPQLPISSVVLSSQFAEDTTSNGPAGAAAVNPLAVDGHRIIPSVTRVFSAGSDMYVYLQAFEKGAKTAAPLTASVAFYKGSVKVMEAAPVTVSDGLDTKSGMMPVRMHVGLGGLVPGEYDCQVSVLDPATQKSALWQKPVMIVP